MKKSYPLPTWAPRIKPYLIRRLYESDAAGRLDTDLLDQVGWALYSRCDSFLLANEAQKGAIQCPVCHCLVLRELLPGMRPVAMLHCYTCSWECPNLAYLETIKNQQLDGGPEVIALFQEFTGAFPKAQEPAEKMLLIDGLIHGFHHFLRSGRTRRPVGINLIDGHLEFVIDFLDHLSYGPGSTPGLHQVQADWREKIHSRSTRRKKPKSAR